jgi:hypothetical protein
MSKTSNQKELDYTPKEPAVSVESIDETIERMQQFFLTPSDNPEDKERIDALEKHLEAYRIDLRNASLMVEQGRNMVRSQDGKISALKMEIKNLTDTLDIKTKPGGEPIKTEKVDPKLVAKLALEMGYTPPAPKKRGRPRKNPESMDIAELKKQIASLKTKLNDVALEKDAYRKYLDKTPGTVNSWLLVRYGLNDDGTPKVCVEADGFESADNYRPRPGARGKGKRGGKK